MGKVLVIEDNDELRERSAIGFESAAYSVQSASDGAAAMPLFERFKPDVVITDVYMPEKDGFEVIAELQANHPMTKVIAVSGSSERLSRVDYLAVSVMHTPVHGTFAPLDAPYHWGTMPAFAAICMYAASRLASLRADSSGVMVSG